MFKKLRNNFLLLNLVILTVLMILSFSAIFLVTWQNVHNNISEELQRASEIRMMMGRGPRSNSMGEGQRQGPGVQNGPHMQQEQSVSFSIITDSDWDTVETITYLSLDDSFYEGAKKQALSRNSDTGSFRLEGNTWAYVKKSNPVGHSITFLNTTSSQAILTNLIYTFLIVAVVMLLFIFAISKFFADRAIRPIKDAFEKQKQFVADSSHELKTPLAVINTNVDVLLANGDKTVGSQVKWLNYIKSETERMTKLTQDLLYLTQMDYSENRMIYSNVNLSDAVTNVILTMEAVIFEKRITLDHDSITPGITVNGNSDQLRQVVMILLDNAVKYTEPGGRIRVTLAAQHHRAVLTVTNTGAGIPEDQLERIFDRFYRTDESRSRKSGGYGLGLAIAKAIVGQHGGQIRAESVLSEKAAFIVELPL